MFVHRQSQSKPRSIPMAALLLEGAWLEEAWFAGGIPGQPEPDTPGEPVLPDQPTEPGEPTVPDQAPPIPTVQALKH